MSLFKRFGWGSSAVAERPADFEEPMLGDIAEETAEYPVDVEIDLRPFIANADVVGLAKVLYPRLTTFDADDGDDDDCIPCAGGAIMLTYSRYADEMGLPSLPDKITPSPMPFDEELEIFFSWLLRLANRLDGHKTAPKCARRRARNLTESVIERNDQGHFQLSWLAAEQVLTASLFAAIRDNFV